MRVHIVGAVPVGVEPIFMLYGGFIEPPVLHGEFILPVVFIMTSSATLMHTAAVYHLELSEQVMLRN